MLAAAFLQGAGAGASETRPYQLGTNLSITFHQPIQTTEIRVNAIQNDCACSDICLWRQTGRRNLISTWQRNRRFGSLDVQAFRITSRVATMTLFFTNFQVKFVSNISGIGSSSASSKYISPLNGNDTSETENFCL